MTLKEASERYGVQRRTLNNAITQGDLAAERAGPLWLVRAAAVERWLERGRRPRGRPVVKRGRASKRESVDG